MIYLYWHVRIFIWLQVSIQCPFISAYRTPFSFSFGANLIVINSLRFCLPGNVFVSPLFLKDNFARCRILGWQLFFLSALWVFQFIAFWPPKFLKRNLLMALLKIPYMWLASLLLFSRFCLCVQKVWLQCALV